MKELIWKHVTNFVGMAFVASVFFFFMSYVEENLVLKEMVVPPAGIKLEEWLDSFRHWALVGILASLGASFIWYILGQWIFKLNNWKESNRRPAWLLIFLLPITAIILAIVLTTQTQEGAWPAYVSYAVNGLMCYYLATALFSPSSYKYTPGWSKKLRRW